MSRDSFRPPEAPENSGDMGYNRERGHGRHRHLKAGYSDVSSYAPAEQPFGNSPALNAIDRATVTGNGRNHLVFHVEEGRIDFVGSSGNVLQSFEAGSGMLEGHNDARHQFDPRRGPAPVGNYPISKRQHNGGILDGNEAWCVNGTEWAGRGAIRIHDGNIVAGTQHRDKSGKVKWDPLPAGNTEGCIGPKDYEAFKQAMHTYSPDSISIVSNNSDAMRYYKDHTGGGQHFAQGPHHHKGPRHTFS